MSKIVTQNVWPGQSGGGTAKPVGLLMVDNNILTLVTEESQNSHVWEWRIVSFYIDYPDNFEVVASVAVDYGIATLVRHQVSD